MENGKIQIDKLLSVESCVHNIISNEILDIMRRGEGRNSEQILDSINYHLAEIMNNYDKKGAI